VITVTDLTTPGSLTDIGLGTREPERIGAPAHLLPRPPMATRAAKVVIDVVGAAVLLLITLPAIAVIAIVVRLALGPGVIFRQTRVGRDGRPFTLMKFRTMRPDRRVMSQQVLDHDKRVTHKTAYDPRHTRLGRFLRKYSLDELPQLVNVLRGEMSLVGPRPELPSVVARYEEWECDRHLVRPGITGLWQVSARGDGMMQEFTYLDVEYVRRSSLRVDMMILLKTVPAVLHRHSC
jgi:lipopolysaccharide/colanic/teichoic acid biosynthesis glycosyltransferase